MERSAEFGTLRAVKTLVFIVGTVGAIVAYMWGRDVGKEKGSKLPSLYGLMYGATYCAIGQILLIILRKLGLYPL